MVGILSLTNAENYGAVLQSLALCYYLNSEIDDAEVIDYTPMFMIGRYRCLGYSGNTLKEKLISLLNNIIILPICLKKKLRFYAFKKKYITMSKKKYLGRIDEDLYDKYIVGSDQIWNLELTNNDDYFFLCFVNSDLKKYSYAASIGVKELSEEQKNEFRKYINGFQGISVREKTADRILRELVTKKIIHTHIDPVFLLDKGNWKKFASPKKIDEEYVIIYTFVDFTKALKIARETGLKIYSIHNSYKGKLSDVKSVPAVGPAEFLSLIMNAQYVVTDSFHGMAFSILFNKQFTVIPYMKTESRMLDLLEELNLQDRVYSDEHNSANLIDYTNVNEIIQNKVNEANMYLRGIVYSEYPYNAN